MGSERYNAQIAGGRCNFIGLAVQANGQAGMSGFRQNKTLRIRKKVTKKTGNSKCATVASPAGTEQKGEPSSMRRGGSSSIIISVPGYKKPFARPVSNSPGSLSSLQDYRKGSETVRK